MNLFFSIQKKFDKIPAWIFAVFSGVLTLIVLWIFVSVIKQYELKNVLLQFKAIPLERMLLAGVFMILSYCFQVLYEYLGLKIFAIRIPFLKVAMVSFIGNSFTNNVGFSMLTGPAIRLRFYHALGVRPILIAKIIVLLKIIFVLGLLSFLSISLVTVPLPLGHPGGYSSVLPITLPIPLPLRIFGGILLLLIFAGVLLFSLSKKRRFQWGELKFTVPPIKMVLAMVGVSGMHFLFASFTLWFLIPQVNLDSAGISWPWNFFGIFLTLRFIVLFVPIPGGLGIWEGAILAILSHRISPATLLGALLGYRIVYYLIPFSLSILLFLLHEVISQKRVLSRKKIFDSPKKFLAKKKIQPL